MGRPLRAAASLDDALAELVVEDVADVVEDNSLVEEDDVVDDASVVEAAPGSLTPKPCATTWLARRMKRRRKGMEDS